MFVWFPKGVVVIFTLSWKLKQIDKINYACLGKQRGNFNFPY